MEITAKDLLQPAAKSGLTLGLIGIIVTLLIYFIDATLLANMWVGITMLIVFLVLVTVFGLNFRKQAGGFLSFKNAFLFSFILLLVAGLAGQLFNYLLFNVIDSELVGLVTNTAVDNAEAMMQKFNVPEEEIDRQLEKTKAQMSNQYTLKGIMKTYLWAILVYAFISLITGAIVKKAKS